MSLTTIIIIISVLVSLAAFNNRELFYKLSFSPYSVKQQNQWYRIITHAFVHGDYMHLFINMFVLWNFGKITEIYFGHFFGGISTFYFILLYVGGIGFATIPALSKHSNNPNYNSIGASGAVAAVLFSYILFNPMNKIYLLFIPIGIPAFLFGILYLIYEVYMEKKSGTNIAHDAHYWGAVYGIVFTIALDPSIISRFFSQILN